MSPVHVQTNFSGSLLSSLLSSKSFHSDHATFLETAINNRRNVCSGSLANHLKKFGETWVYLFIYAICESTVECGPSNYNNSPINRPRPNSFRSNSPRDPLCLAFFTTELEQRCQRGNRTFFGSFSLDNFTFPEKGTSLVTRTGGVSWAASIQGVTCRCHPRFPIPNRWRWERHGRGRLSSFTCNYQNSFVSRFPSSPSSSRSHLFFVSLGIDRAARVGRARTGLSD